MTWHIGGKRKGPIIGPSHLATDWWISWWSSQYGSNPPCTAPTKEDLKARFPEFTNYADAKLNFAIQDATGWADSSWAGNCDIVRQAILYLAAHFLALNALAAQALPKEISDDEGGTLIEGGQVTSIGFEMMRVGFSSPKFAASGGGRGGGMGNIDQYDLSSTPYGQRYLDLLEVNVPPVLVV